MRRYLPWLLWSLAAVAFILPLRLALPATLSHLDGYTSVTEQEVDDDRWRGQMVFEWRDPAGRHVRGPVSLDNTHEDFAWEGADIRVSEDGTAYLQLRLVMPMVVGYGGSGIVACVVGYLAYVLRKVPDDAH